MPKPLAFRTVRFQPGEAMLWGCGPPLARMVLWSSAWLLGYSWWGWCTAACVWPEYGESVSRTVSSGEVQAEPSAVLKPPSREGGLCPQRLWGPTYKNSPSPSWAEAVTPRFPCSWHLKWDETSAVINYFRNNRGSTCHPNSWGCTCSVDFNYFFRAMLAFINHRPVPLSTQGWVGQDEGVMPAWALREPPVWSWGVGISWGAMGRI